MGIYCPCGVYVDAHSEINHIQKIVKCKCRIIKKVIRSRLSYLADICSTTLETSTLSLTYEDIQAPSNSFFFKANSITSVICRQEGQICIVTVKGTGIVKGQQFPFEAVFCEGMEQSSSIVQKFVIHGFFDQNDPLPVSQGTIVTRGCQ
ncbi:hypothetical protein ACQKP0_11840 [Heyndrickxia sp. NPDC080065]|uniref:hypothetical protein n=1 Tax=Heyndrickxia sp. NPDC080065 TaxID=3390568 RepID=UPI003CFC2E3D